MIQCDARSIYVFKTSVFLGFGDIFRGAERAIHIVNCVLFSKLIYSISFIVSIFVFLNNMLCKFIFIYGRFNLKNTAYILYLLDVITGVSFL